MKLLEENKEKMLQTIDLGHCGGCHITLPSPKCDCAHLQAVQAVGRWLLLIGFRFNYSVWPRLRVYLHESRWLEADYHCLLSMAVVELRQLSWDTEG